MSGAPDPLYVLARKALLATTDALAAHLDAVVLVGAQAIYVHAAETDLLDPTLGSVRSLRYAGAFALCGGLHPVGGAHRTRIPSTTWLPP